MPHLPTPARRLALVLALAVACVAVKPAPALAAEPAPAPVLLYCAADLPTSLSGAAPTAAAADEEEDDSVDLSNLAWRHGHLQVHQGLGLATLASMAATVGMGYWLTRQNGTSGVFDGHLLLAGLTTGLYLTSATLALTAPPQAIAHEEGPWDTTKIHRNLAWLHAAGMVSVVSLGLLSTFSSLAYSPYHGIAGYTTVSLMALSAGVIVFGQ